MVSGPMHLSDEAIAKVYEAKNRPLGMPISIAVSDFDMLASVSRTDPWMQEFIATFLPGPVTVVLPARRFIPEVLTGGTGLIGIRIPCKRYRSPDHQRFDGPITATSANLHGARDPVTRDQVTVPYELFVDGGKLPGTPSTVVDLLTRTIIRKGHVCR